LTAASYSRVLGANDKIRVGLIGSGGQGKSDWKSFLKNPDVTPVAVCDVYEPNLEQGLSLAKGEAKGYRDFRKLLEQKDIDAVIVGTPDHWHALTTIAACQAGKDVYCEKPLSLAIREGRLMLEAARKNNRIVQTGSQQRSGPHYAQAVEIIQSGKLGKVSHIKAALVRNAMPGWGKATDEAPPANLNWDMWLGPAPKRPYNRMRCLYNFRWFWDYSGGQMTNFGAHDVDIARWALNARAPIAVAAFGGRFAMEGDGETPDVQEVIYQFPGCVLNWSVCEMNAEQKSGLTFHGTKATMFLTRGGITINGEIWKGLDAQRTPQAPDAKIPGTEQHNAHVRNFLDCVKSRKRPNADVEDGHLTAATCHMGNIATRLGRSLKWDAVKEEFIGDADANRWLERPYRAPWKLS
jgi:predicted dehydrogenase